MQRYDKMALTPEQYSLGRSVQEKNGTVYSEQKFGSRKSLYIGGMIIGSTMVESNLNIGAITNQEFRLFLAAFNKKLYKRLRNEVHLYNLKIPRSGPVSKKDVSIWNAIPIGSFFYNLDLSAAYWQIAHRIGYIDTNTFRKYLEDDRYKQAKRLCFSFLGRENKMTYFHPDQKTSFEIVCDMTVLRNVYDNVRNELNKIIVTASKNAGEFIEYNTDGIAVFYTKVDVVKKYFQSEGLVFKITKCKKHSNTHYLSGSVLRKYKNQ